MNKVNYLLHYYTYNLKSYSQAQKALFNKLHGNHDSNQPKMFT